MPSMSTVLPQGPLKWATYCAMSNDIQPRCIQHTECCSQCVFFTLNHTFVPIDIQHTQCPC